jgi:hypothetical protein
MLQVPVSPDLLRELKVLAAAEDLHLRDYVRRELVAHCHAQKQPAKKKPTAKKAKK